MKSVMEIEQITSCLEKIELYRDEEQLVIEDIINILTSINKKYNSSNTKKINDLNVSLFNKFDVITNIHEKNVTVIEKNIEKYCVISKKVDKLLELGD